MKAKRAVGKQVSQLECRVKTPVAWRELPSVTIPNICRESREIALRKLTLQALALKRGDGATFGDSRIDAEHLFLSKVEASKTAHVRGLKLFLNQLWPSEARLNRFLIRLGKKLEGERHALPDWSNVDQLEMLIAEGWSESIVVDGELWPPLCCFTYPALAKFLQLCKPQRWRPTDSPRTLERAIQRIGLIPIPLKDRIRQVERRGGEFHFL